MMQLWGDSSSSWHVDFGGDILFMIHSIIFYIQPKSDKKVTVYSSLVLALDLLHDY